MNIYKVAQVPTGFVVLETKINLDEGTIKNSFVRSGNSKCGATDGEWLEDLLSTNVPGFGGDEVVDAGRTGEYYEQNRPQVARPPAQKVNDEYEGYQPQQQKQRQLDNQFGV